MKIELKDSIPKPVTEMDIIVDGEKIGEVKTASSSLPDSYRYHAIIHLHRGLLQGHGPSPEEAITDAIKEGRLNCARVVNFIDELECRLGA